MCFESIQWPLYEGGIYGHFCIRSFAMRIQRWIIVINGDNNRILTKSWGQSSSWELSWELSWDQSWDQFSIVLKDWSQGVLSCCYLTIKMLLTYSEITTTLVLAPKIIHVRSVLALHSIWWKDNVTIFFSSDGILAELFPYREYNVKIYTMK